MNVTEFQTRPIDQWPGQLTPHRKRLRSPFSVAYGTLNNDLMRELELLNAKGVALLMALREDDIRLDGRPRAGTKPAHPGVIVVAAQTKFGPMRWACDTYDDWAANLRAVTLTLRNLRMIDKYGCTKRGEQYAGWKALPNPDAQQFDPGEARRTIRDIIGIEAFERLTLDEAVTEAIKKTHPDHGGDPAAFKRVMQSRKAIQGK